MHNSAAQHTGSAEKKVNAFVLSIFDITTRKELC